MNGEKVNKKFQNAFKLSLCVIRCLGEKYNIQVIWYDLSPFLYRARLMFIGIHVK